MKYVFSRVGTLDPSVLVGPSIGEDAAVIDLGDGRVLVAHVDPITGAVEYLGWLAVHIACNDVAVRGVKPRWLLPVLYLPEGVGEDVLDRITSQIDQAAREVGAMVVGGHSEFTPGLDRPLISMTALGITEKSKYATTSGARVGDAVLITKTVGIEGTAILSADFREVLLRRGVSLDVIRRGGEFIKRVSVIREALALSEAGLATSMHDPTEGGLLGGLTEIAFASGKTLYVWEEKVRVAEETAVMAAALGLDPLKLISSGTLIATLSPDKISEALKLLEDVGIEASVVGFVGEKSDSLVVINRKDGTVERISEVYVEDELFRAWKTWKVMLEK